MCFGVCVCAGALRGSACPVSTNRWVWGCTSRRGEEVSAGFEAPEGAGTAWIRPGPRGSPHPHPRRGASSHCTWVFPSCFPSSDQLGGCSRSLTGSSPPLPQISPFLSLPRPPPFQFDYPSRCLPIPRPWRLGKRGKAKAGSLPDPLARVNRGLFPGLQGVGVCVRGPGRQAELGEKGSCASRIMPPSRDGSQRRPTRVPEVKQDV